MLTYCLITAVFLLGAVGQSILDDGPPPLEGYWWILFSLVFSPLLFPFWIYLILEEYFK